MRTLTLHLLLLFFCAQAHAGIFECKDKYREVKAAAVAQALVPLGYHPSSAKRFAIQYPEYADKVLELAKRGDRGADPVKVYRGLKVAWQDYRPDFLVNRPGGRPPKKEINFDYTLGLPARFASWAKDTDSPTVLEAQVPRFLIHIVTRDTLGRNIPIALTKEVPDITPFITRVGVVDKTREMDSDSRYPHPYVEWANYDDVPPPAKPRLWNRLFGY